MSIEPERRSIRTGQAYFDTLGALWKQRWLSSLRIEVNRRLSHSAGGTNSGDDGGGVTVWIPLQRVQLRLLAAGHLQGPK